MLNVEMLHNRLINGQKIESEFRFISDETTQDIYNLLINILSYFDQLFLAEIISTILKELLMNAVKANAKRLFFQRRNLIIENLQHYKLGMSEFLNEVTYKWDEQKDFIEESEYYVRLEILPSEESLGFRVTNNSSILPEELERIKKRIESAKKYNDLSDAFLDLSDNQESAGLGIILTQVLLKNSGIGTEKFRIDSDEKQTVASLDIPKNAIPKVMRSKFNEKILNEIETIPQLPQSLHRIISLCNNPEAEMQSIATEIEKNPALSAELLKLSNSTLFLTRNKVSNILTAIKIVGLKNIKNMLYVSGVRKLLSNRYGKVQHIWEHSNKCSVFAREIAFNYGKSKLMDLASIGGLLHDIGKLILLSLDKNLIKQMDNLIEKANIHSVLIEEVSLGISHAEIGSVLAKKWAFPDELVDIIAYHHRPFLAPDSDREVTEIVYLANKMVDVLSGVASYYTIDKKILETYGLDDIDKFNRYTAKLNSKYI